MKFLYEVQEREMVWRWGAQSAVFDHVAWLQALWASRKPVCSLVLYFYGSLDGKYWEGKGI